MLLAVARGVSAICRLSLGPLMPLLATDLSIDTAVKGQMLSSFSTGYLFTQVAGGRFADSFGAKSTVFLVLIVTAVALAVVPEIVTVFGAPGLTVVYFGLGAVNGPLFPACSVMLRHVASKDKASAMAIVDAGATLGGCLATVVPTVAFYLSWPMLYRLLALLCAGASVAWGWCAREPVAAPRHEASESLGVRKMLSLFLQPGIWALFLAHGVFNYANYFLNAWMPTMFVDQFDDVDAATVGAFLMWPEVVGVMSRFVSAAVADRYVLKSGRLSLLSVRKGGSVVAFLGQGVALYCAVRQGTPVRCVFFLMCASTAAAVHSCGFKPNYLDLTTAYSGVLSGIGNTFASVASAVGPAITSEILLYRPGDWLLLFNGLFLMNCLGACVVALFLSVDNLDLKLSRVSPK